jgi:hypothetical protein
MGASVQGMEEHGAAVADRIRQTSARDGDAHMGVCRVPAAIGSAVACWLMSLLACCILKFLYFSVAQAQGAEGKGRQMNKE